MFTRECKKNNQIQTIELTCFHEHSLATSSDDFKIISYQIEDPFDKTCISEILVAFNNMKLREMSSAYK